MSTENLFDQIEFFPQYTYLLHFERLTLRRLCVLSHVFNFFNTGNSRRIVVVWKNKSGLVVSMPEQRGCAVSSVNQRLKNKVLDKEMVLLPRSSLQVTFDTWKALFLREAIKRISAQRAAWMWVLFEPMSHIGFILLLYTTVRVRTIGGIDTAIWIIGGMLPFFLFRRTAVQCMNAVSANRALFAYRQVKPIDTVLVRAGVEGFLMLLVSMILLACLKLADKAILPANILLVLEGGFGLWLLGLGFGLMASVAAELVPELERVVGIVMFPLYLLSGVMIPVAGMPLPFRDWLLFNPIVHGLESVRVGFAPYYHAVPGLNIAYLYGVALCMVFFGLALHRRFAHRMVME